jgi:diguanylate cyclase (GGDEF)-like protein
MAHLKRAFGAQWWARLFTAVVALSLIAGSALALHVSQTSGRRGVSQRYDARTQLAANFVSTYVAQVTARERAVAITTLTGTDPRAAFASDVQAFGFQAGVLLDAQGRALSILPNKLSLIGQQFGTKYAHLTLALRDHVAVSNIVRSAVRAAPVVAFAVPFHTRSGLRVFSGAYTIADTPLAAFLTDSTTLKDAHVYLTDATGAVLASNGQPPQNVRTLAQRDAALGHALLGGSGGSYTSHSTSFTFARHAVSGTPWSLVLTAPSSEVFVSIGGSSHWLPWMILLALSLLIVVVGYLAIRLLEGRRRLGKANHELAKIARTDGLTGLFNRFYLTEQVEAALANSARHDFPVCVLMIDIDHFKNLNDTYGHQAGDLAIRHVADCLTSSLRDGDLLGRWGGEEFLAVLPFTGLAEGLEAAERLRRLVATSPVELPGGSGPVTVYASVGVAMAADDSLASLVDRADQGLYAAKAAGRNTVRTGVPAQVLAAGSDHVPAENHDPA